VVLTVAVFEHTGFHVSLFRWPTKVTGPTTSPVDIAGLFRHFKSERNPVIYVICGTNLRFFSNFVLIYAIHSVDLNSEFGIFWHSSSRVLPHR